MSGSGRTRRALAALGVAVAVVLTGCGADRPQETQPDDRISERTLAMTLAEAPDLSVLSGALGDAGLLPMLDGIASYTVLAPRDPAFVALGPLGEELVAPSQRPAMAIVLRDHILPGFVTRVDIVSAIETAGGPVTMRSMGNHAITFTREGSSIFASAPDGSRARLVGKTLRASNGAAIRLDGLLKAISDPAGDPVPD